jgi:hypothetical protein
MLSLDEFGSGNVCDLVDRLQVRNALQRLQSIARPSIECQIEEKLRERMEQEGQGGPDGSSAYYRRLQKGIDQQTGNRDKTRRNGGNGLTKRTKPAR